MILQWYLGTQMSYSSTMAWYSDMSECILMGYLFVIRFRHGGEVPWYADVLDHTRSKRRRRERIRQRTTNPKQRKSKSWLQPLDWRPRDHATSSISPYISHSIPPRPSAPTKYKLQSAVGAPFCVWNCFQQEDLLWINLDEVNICYFIILSKYVMFIFMYWMTQSLWIN